MGDLASEDFIQMKWLSDWEWLQSPGVACHLSHMPQFHNDFMPQRVAHSIEKKRMFPAIYY